MKKKKLFLLWPKILLLINCLNPLPIKEIKKVNDTGYYLIIDSINMHIFFDQQSTLDDGLELHEASKKGGPIIISGHSGNGKAALFNDLEYLEKGQKIKIIHNNYQKEFIIMDLIFYEKYSNIIIPDDNQYLYLITCDKKDMKKQLIINAKLANIEYF